MPYPVSILNLIFQNYFDTGWPKKRAFQGYIFLWNTYFIRLVTVIFPVPIIDRF